jgi:hypothetical protein
MKLQIFCQIFLVYYFMFTDVLVLWFELVGWPAFVLLVSII